MLKKEKRTSQGVRFFFRPAGERLSIREQEVSRVLRRIAKGDGGVGVEFLASSESPKRGDAVDPGGLRALRVVAPVSDEDRVIRLAFEGVEKVIDKEQAEIRERKNR